VKTSRAAKLALAFWVFLVVLGVYVEVSELVLVAGILGALTAVSVGYQNFRLGRVMYQVLEIVAQQLGLASVESRR